MATPLKTKTQSDIGKILHKLANNFPATTEEEKAAADKAAADKAAADKAAADKAEADKAEADRIAAEKAALENETEEQKTARLAAEAEAARLEAEKNKQDPISELLKELGVKTKDELKSRKLVEVTDWEATQRRLNELDDRWKREDYKTHPDFVENYQKPMASTLINIRKILEADGVEKPLELLKAIQSTSGKERFDILKKSTVSEFARAGLIGEISKYDDIASRGEEALKRSTAELEAATKAYKANQSGNSAKARAALKVILDNAISEPDLEWFQQKPIAGLVGAELARVQADNAKAVARRAEAEKLLLSDNKPQDLVETVTKALGFDSLKERVDYLEAQLQDRDAKIAKITSKSLQLPAGSRTFQDPTQKLKVLSPVEAREAAIKAIMGTA
jgi:hypothetical protein